MLSIVLAITGEVHDFYEALQALSDITDHLESAGDAPQVVLVAPDADAAVLGLLAAVEGATPVVVSHHVDRVEMWLAGTRAASGETVWLLDTTSAVGAATLRRLLPRLAYVDAVLDRDHVLVRRDALDVAAEGWRFPAVEGNAADPASPLQQLGQALAAAGRSSMPADSERVLAAPHGMDAEILRPGDEPATVVVGRHTYAGDTSVIHAFPRGDVFIGAFCSISWRVLICNHGGTGVRLRDLDGRPLPTRLTQFAAAHHPETAASYPFSNAIRPRMDCIQDPGPGSVLARPLRIGNDVWIGIGASVVGGVTIGDGAVISAGAVVLDDVPPYSVVVGNPARVVRSRFSAPVVEQLLAIRWWDWPDEVIAERGEWFTRPIGEFVAEFAPAASLST